MDINFFFEDTKEIELEESRDIKWILQCIKKYKKEAANLNFIFCSDSYLLKINQEYLDHDYYTDIITFDNCMENLISGDIYISMDRVEENADNLKEDFLIELHRVMIHGVLHLLGLKDGTEEEKTAMTNAEDSCIKIFLHI